MTKGNNIPKPDNPGGGPAPDATPKGPPPEGIVRQIGVQPRLPGKWWVPLIPFVIIGIGLAAWFANR